MKQLFIICLLLSGISQAYSQKNFIDMPYVETFGKADSMVVPDRIYISILLDEADSKNKKSVEELEKLLESTLKKININTEKELRLNDVSSNFKTYFLKGQNVLKSKSYSLLVHDAVTAGRVLGELELVGISNVNIEKTEYSGAEMLMTKLKMEATKKSKNTATTMLSAINQKAGKAIFISDLSNAGTALFGQSSGIVLRGTNRLSETVTVNPINIEFKKLKFEVTVFAKYLVE